MKDLYQDWKENPARGYTDAELQKAVEDVAGHSMGEFFEKYVFGTEAIDYVRYLEPVGLELESTPSDKVALGIRMDDNGVVTRVVRGSSAYKGGINVNDELLAVDGYRLNDNISDLPPRQGGR